MQKKDFTQYNTKEDFLKDFPIIDGCLNLSNQQINDNDLIHILRLIGVEPSLKRLDLDNNQLKTLPVDIFNGLSNLEGLSLSSNNLTDIPVGIFNDLSSLKKLFLHSNKLKTLPVGVFNGLSNLELLYLDNNKLKTLPMSIKKSLPNDCKIHTDSDFEWVEDVIENKSGEHITQIQMIIEKNNLKIQKNNLESQKFQDENNVLQRALKILINTKNN